MADTYLTFKRFRREETVNDLIQKLRELHIDFEVEDRHKFFGPSFADNKTDRDISLKLKPADFSIAQKELENYYQSRTRHSDPGHYLFNFSNKELQDIIEKPDECADFDFELAQKILEDRRKEINAEFIANPQKRRKGQAAVPRPYHRRWIYFGYFFAILGGLFGIIIGWHLCHSKRTLPDGRSVCRYSEWERMHGRLILLLGSILLPIWIMVKIRYQSGNY